MAKEKEKEKEKGSVPPEEEQVEAVRDEQLNEEQDTDDALTEIEMLQSQIRELKDQNLRQFAEFDNFRKRSARERAELYNLAVAETVGSFLEVLDNLERALESSEEESGLKTGLGMVCTQFKNTFEKLGVTEIESENQIFDPEIHSAAGQISDENYGENTICRVLQKGYRLGDKIIRNPMVVVANP